MLSISDSEFGKVIVSIHSTRARENARSKCVRVCRLVVDCRHECTELPDAFYRVPVLDMALGPAA